MDLLISTGVTSALIGFCFWLLEKRISEHAEKEQEERTARQKQIDEKEKNREQLQYAMLKAIDGSLALSEATAKAVQRIPDAKCNGDMHSALEYELKSKHDLENFLTRQGVNHVVEGMN